MNDRGRAWRASRDRADRCEVRQRIAALFAELLIITVIATLVFTDLFGMIIQRGNDMYPAVRDRDIVVFYRRSDPVRTQAVVYMKNGSLHSGRIAAAGGSVIGHTEDNKLTIDGLFLPAEPSSGIYSDTMTAGSDYIDLKLEPGTYYILNDNRERMSDSRSYGAVRNEEIKGNIVAVLRTGRI